jgi:hypothetical protein
MSSKKANISFALLRDLVLYSGQLSHLAYGKMTLRLLHDIGTSFPLFVNQPGAYLSAYIAAREKAFAYKHDIQSNYTPEEWDVIKSKDGYVEELIASIPFAQHLLRVDNFFVNKIMSMDIATRKACDAAFSDFVKMLTQPLIMELFAPIDDTMDAIARWDCEVSRPHFYNYVSDIEMEEDFWDELKDYGEGLTQHAAYARSLMMMYLGFQPQARISVRLQNAVRKQVDLFAKDKIDGEAFDSAVYKLVQDARNKHIGGDILFSKKREYDDGDMQSYKRINPGFNDAVRKRLSDLLGYTPDLRYSLYAEYGLLARIKDGPYPISTLPIPEEMEALSAIKYREFLLNEGKEAAENSPLIARQEPFKSQLQKKHAG